MARYIVLGRFQPFHMGHEYLVKSAYEHVGEDGQLVIAIGSQQAGWEPTNPWTADERKAMIKAWSQSENMRFSGFLKNGGLSNPSIIFI